MKACNVFSEYCSHQSLEVLMAHWQCYPAAMTQLMNVPNGSEGNLLGTLLWLYHICSMLLDMSNLDLYIAQAMSCQMGILVQKWQDILFCVVI